MPDEGAKVARLSLLLHLHLFDSFTRLLAVLHVALILSELLTSIFFASQYS